MNLSPVLVWLGNNSALQPEEAKTWSVGLDFAPSFAPTTSIALSHFNIRYDERIDVPAGGADQALALINAARYPGLIDRAPSAEQLQMVIEGALGSSAFANTTPTPFDPATDNILEAFPDPVLLDNRYNNVALEDVSGVDLVLDGRVETRRGDFMFGLNGTYYLELERKTTATSPAIDQLNAPGKPVDFRFRANAGWMRSAYGAFVYVNYVDGYADTHSSVPSTRTDSWTTVDCAPTAERISSPVAGPFTAHCTSAFSRRPPRAGKRQSCADITG